MHFPGVCALKLVNFFAERKGVPWDSGAGVFARFRLEKVEKVRFERR